MPAISGDFGRFRAISDDFVGRRDAQLTDRGAALLHRLHGVLDLMNAPLRERAMRGRAVRGVRRTCGLHTDTSPSYWLRNMLASVAAADERRRGVVERRVARRHLLRCHPAHDADGSLFVPVLALGSSRARV